MEFAAALRANTSLFDPSADVFVARAPGRLDLMGGIADYSGSLVLELPIEAAAFSAAQARTDRQARVRTTTSAASGGETDVTIPLEALLGDYDAVQRFFAQNPSRHWAAYVLGAITVLHRERGVPFDRGVTWLLASAVPAGKGLSSSAAIEVAAMRALTGVLGLQLTGRDLALLCQKVENLLVGAPCGVMDQMTAACGESRRLLSMLCQPAELQPSVALPGDIEVFGIDSGIRHAVTGSDYASVRIGAFMGLRIIRDLAGQPDFLANVTPGIWESQLRDHVPERIKGAEFLRQYGGFSDTVTSIDPRRTYAVRQPTAHPIYEHDRVKRFAALLRTLPLSDETLIALGHLMYESHASYSACGLGSDGTDLIVSLVRAGGPAHGLFGAKITGGGSGGTVAVLARAGAREAVEAIAGEYTSLSGRRADVVSGSSSGAMRWGLLHVSNWSATGVMERSLESAMNIDRVAQQLLDAIREGDTDVARRLLEAHPAVSRVSIHTAAATGDANAVATFIGTSPALVHETHGPDEWPPLACACASGLHAIDSNYAARLLEIANRLIDAGASVNSGSVWKDNDGKAQPISVLYHACMSNNVAMVTMLLDRGANTADGESIYHAAQHNRRECLEAMAKHGADFSSQQSPYGNTPLYFLAGHQSDEGGRADWAQGFKWLLDHGADPSVTSYDHKSTPLHAVAAGGRNMALQWLVEAGANVNAVNVDGRTSYAIALRVGNRTGAAFLIAHGADATAATRLDRFLDACLAGDGASARAFLAEQPNLMATLGPRDRGAMSNAVRAGNDDALRMMVQLGFNLEWQEKEGGTPLHTAAWLGKVAPLKTLLQLGAPVNVRDTQFGSSSVGWAAHGSKFAKSGTEDDYCAIVDLLIDAGATREASINRWGEPPEGMATEAVAARLRSRGLAP